MDSILTSIKNMLGIVEEFYAFDESLIIYINTAFATVRQLGVGPPEGFSISDDTATWDDVDIDPMVLGMAKTLIYMKVRQMFDPATGAAADAIKSSISELEWRITNAIDVELKEGE